MKKIVSLLAATALTLSMTNALALNYQQLINSDSTFETLEEAKANAITFLSENANAAYTYVNDPALATYPANTTYVYRSASQFSCDSAGARMNTNILVYTDAKLADKDAAMAYLADMGLIDIIEEAKGSIVLVTPINPEAGFGAADQFAYYQLQQVMCNIGFGNRATGEYYAENKYFGGLTNRYLIAVDGGATFFNDYISSTLDYVSRLAGVLVVNGKMASIRNVAGRVPAYLVNPSASTVEKYKAANETDSCGYEGDLDLYYNAQRNLQKVVVKNTDDVDLKAIVEDAYYNMFIKAMRNAVVQAGLNTASTPYSNYNFNQTPYSLSRRNAVLNGKTADGLHVIEKHEDRFIEYITESGEYVDTWYEVLPEEVLNNTAPAGTIPLILANHGGGDDPVQFLDEIGWLNVAGDERIAIIAPRHQEAYARGIDFEPALVKYMLETYPALDASHVYVTGYSYGGNETYKAVKNGASLFAAMVPMGSTSDAKEDWTPVQEGLELPYMIITATQDFAAYNSAEDRINDNCVGCINKMAAWNNMDTVEVDFNEYPIIGFRADKSYVTVLNGEYTNHQWYLCNEKGWPMVGCNVTEYMPHGLYQEFAVMGWDYMKHFTRNPETLEVTYDPYVK